MTHLPTKLASDSDGPWVAPSTGSPFLRAPEGVRTIFLVTLAAAGAPLAWGILVFGWRAAMIAGLCIFSCAFVEKMYYRVTRFPALLGRSHAYLTGMLLALTLPPFVDWYVPVIASAFAIIVGKAIFGGVGHFLWQPALVGRVAVAVLFAGTMNPPAWPLLAADRMIVGDAAPSNLRKSEDVTAWRSRNAPLNADGFLLCPPAAVLADLTRSEEPQFCALAYPPTKAGEEPSHRPALFSRLPQMGDLLIGARPGGIGETSAVVLVMAGLYLIYRGYLKWQLPASVLLSAGVVAAVAPIHLAGASGPQWCPLWSPEGTDVGFIYVWYQLLAGQLFLAAFFLGTEMTCRPVTRGGQVLFGLGCGTGAMLLQLYVDTPIPAYAAILAMNTLTPTIDAIWRPRVLGYRRFAWLLGKRA